MLPTPQLSIATCWPGHPSMSAFVFYYTLSQRSILSTNLTDSMAYKYNNKDTRAIFMTHRSNGAIKTNTFAWMWLWWHLLRHPLASQPIFSIDLVFFTPLIRLYIEWPNLFWLIGGNPYMLYLRWFQIVSRASWMGPQLTWCHSASQIWSEAIWFVFTCLFSLFGFILLDKLWILSKENTYLSTER